jgi:radical SAM superfamily enzyme YgiQ (UPF0313 family)
MLELRYDEPLFRPPAEAYSMIFQVTLGCSWNRCAFCDMYFCKTFTVRKEEDVLEEIRHSSVLYRGIKKVFLADGNAMVLSASRMLTILDAIRKSYPDNPRVSAYALPKDILTKTPEELKQMRELGLELLYIGIESGDDDVLRMVNKDETAASTAEGILKAKEAGMTCSVMVINGVAGLKYSQQHAEHSADLLNKVQPRFFSVLALSLPLGLDHYKNAFKGTYIPMDEVEMLKELEMMMQHTRLERTIFRSDHVSNLLTLKGILPRDKEKLLNTIREAVSF